MSLEISALASLFELSRDAVTGIENGAVRFANPAARELLGIREGDSAAQYFPEEILRSTAERFIAAGTIGGRSVTVSVTRRDGLTICALPREETPAESLTGYAAAELGALLMTERMALDRLFELRGQSDDESAEKYASILYRTHYRVKRLHEHLAMASLMRRRELPCTRQMLALDEVVAGVCDTTAALAPDTGVKLCFSSDEVFHIRGDRHLLEVLVFNLLSNSLLHTKPGGTINVNLTRQGQRCILAVDDTGDGIPPERLAELLPGVAAPDISDPAAGLGLGLLLVRGIAELHGGTVLLESRETVGTRLRVSFPLLSPAESVKLREAEPIRPDGADLALTELSGVLPRNVYTQRMFD